MFCRGRSGPPYYNHPAFLMTSHDSGCYKQVTTSAAIFLTSIYSPYSAITCIYLSHVANIVKLTYCKFFKERDIHKYHNVF